MAEELDVKILVEMIEQYGLDETLLAMADALDGVFDDCVDDQVRRTVQAELISLAKLDMY